MDAQKQEDVKRSISALLATIRPCRRWTILQHSQLANLTAENLETTGTEDLAKGADLKTAVLETAVRRRETTIVLCSFLIRKAKAAKIRDSFECTDRNQTKSGSAR